MTEEQKANATLAGGTEVEVRYRAGEPEKVLVRELPVKDYPRLLAALVSEERQAEIYCGKPEGWADTLTAASHHDVMQAGEALNKGPFFGWFDRRTEKTRRMQPKEMDRLVATAQKEIEEALRNGSLKLPSNAA